MKKYTLLIAIGSLFLSTQLPAMGNNEASYKSFLHRLIIREGIYPKGFLNPNALADRNKEIVDTAEKLGLHRQTAENLLYETLIDGFVHYGFKGPLDNPLSKANYKKMINNKLGTRVQGIVQDIFKKF